MKQRFYLDTSVFGGVYDREFSESSTGVFDLVRQGKVICLYSELVERELDRAPERVRALIETILPINLEKLSVTPEIIQLANRYVAERVIGESSFDDCLHIASATVFKADALVSWNFKHIVNISRIRGYNSVNLIAGYSALEIRSPKEVT